MRLKLSNKKRLLFIEDDKDVLFSLCEYAESFEYNVLAADTFENAVKQLESCHIDIIITDYNLDNGKTGVDIIKAIIKLQERLGTPPVFVFSGGTDINSINSMTKKFQYPSILCIQKPGVDELFEEIKKL